MILPYDPEATNPLNLKSEVKKLSDLPNKYNCLIPTYAPFYRRDLIIRTVDGVDLYEGLDYYLAVYYEEMSSALKMPLYGGIILNNPDLVINFVQYRSIGSPHIATASEVTSYLSDPEMTPPRSTDWNKILVRKVDIAVEEPPKTMDEALERDIVVKGMRLLVDALIQSNDSKEIGLEDIMARISNVNETYNAHKFEKHTQDTGLNAHPLTPEQLNLALKTDTSSDAALHHGVNKQDSIDAMRSAMLQYSDMDELANRDNMVVDGLLNIGENVSLSIKDGMLLDNGESLKISLADGVLEINVAVNANNISNFFLAALSQNFTFDGTKEVCYINGLPVLTMLKAPDFIRPTVGGSSRLVTANSNTVAMVGIGTSDQPLAADAFIPNASTTQRGLFDVKNERGLNTIATSGFLFDIKVKVDKLADKDFSINGVKFSKTMTLTKASVGLSNVDNTTALNKVISDAMRTAIDNKALFGHTHSPEELDGLEYATETNKGVSMFVDSTTGNSDELIVYTETITAIYDIFLEDINKLDTLLGRAKRPGYYYPSELPITYTQLPDSRWEVIVESFPFYYNGVLNRTVASRGYDVRYLGFKGTKMSETTSNMFVVFRGVDGYKILGSSNFGYNREWLEHINDPMAHSDSILNGYYSLIENYPTVRTREPLEYYPLTKWDRFSHDANSYDQPARLSDLNGWDLSGTSFDVSRSTDSSTFTGLVNSVKKEAYSGYTTIYFDSSSSGVVSVIIALWLNEEGVEQTISITASDKKHNSLLDVRCGLWRNYGQSDAELIVNIDATPDALWDDLTAIQVIYSATNYDLTYSVGCYKFYGDLCEVDVDLDIHNTTVLYSFNGYMPLTEEMGALDKLKAPGIGSLRNSSAIYRIYQGLDDSIKSNYASQPYIKETLIDESTHTEITTVKHTVSFLVEVEGVYKADVATSNKIRLDNPPTFPSTVSYNLDSVTGITTITITAMFLDADGGKLYEPPSTLSDMVVTELIRNY